MALFVSHVSAQRHVAVALAQRLEARGCPCWYAPRDIPAGSIWDEQIAAAIHGCDHFLLVFSAKADLSPHVKRELALADKYRKPILWLRTDSTEPELLAYYLTDTQWLDWSGDPDDAAEALIATMAGDTTRINLRRRSVSRRSLLVGGGVAGAAAGAGLWLSFGPRSNPAPVTSSATLASSSRGASPAVAPRSVVKTVNVPGAPSDAVVGGNVLFVAGAKDGVARIDLETWKALEPLSLKGTSYGLDYDPIAHRLWVAGHSARTLTSFDADHPGQADHIAHVGSGTGPFRVVVDSVGKRVYVSSSSSHSYSVRTVDVFHTETRKRLESLSVGRNPGGMCVDPLTRRVLVTSRNDDSVWLVDPVNAPHRGRPIPVGKRPFRCAIDPKTRLAYVANGYDERLTVIDLSHEGKEKVVDWIKIGFHPVGVAINTESRLAYVSLAGKQDSDANKQAHVVIFSLDDPSRKLTVVDTRTGTTGITVDSTTGLVYTANRESHSVTIISPG